MYGEYDIYDRKDGSSTKYDLAYLANPTVDKQNALIFSHADMQFKFSQKIYQKLKQNLKQPHFGYTQAKPSVWKALNSWVKNRYQENIELSKDNTIMWSNMCTLFKSVLQILTNPGDNILTFTPSYYMFNLQASYCKRNMLEVQLKTENNRFYIDFEQLEQKIKSNDIKVLVLINPHNPCGRIWSKQELQKIKDLVLKYKVFLFSDQIYSDAVQPQQGQLITDKFTSMLRFPQIYDYLIYGNSYSKAWNSSGMPLSYSFIHNKQIFQKMYNHMIFGMIAIPCAISFSILQILYTSEQSLQWRKQTIKYIKNNFNLFKKLCQVKLSKLYFYDLQVSYLCLVDFKDYGLQGQELKNIFRGVDICPTFTQKFFIQQKPRSLVRINLACNVEIIHELVKRLQKAIYKQ